MTMSDVPRNRGRRARLLSSLVLAGAASFSNQMAAIAQTVPLSSSAEIRIPAGPLTGALNRLAAATGLQILYDAGLANGRTTQGYAGTTSPEMALRALLAGTGLTYTFTDARTVTLSAPGTGEGYVAEDGVVALDPIDVTTSGGRAQAEAARRDAPYQTPGSSAYIPAEQIERFGGSTAGDIFKSTPGVIASGNHSGGASVDVNIRGMQGQSRVKVAIDGTQQSTTTWRGYLGVDERVYIDPDFIGGIEIDKGPSDGADGAGAIGGVVGIRTLLPEDIVQDGKQWGVRVRTGTNDNAVAPPGPLTYDKRTDAPDFFDFENGFANAALATRQENFEFIAAVAKRKSGNYFAGENGQSEYLGRWGMRPLSFTGPGEEAFNTSEDSMSALAKAKFMWGDGHSVQFGYTHFESKFGEAMGSLLFNEYNYWRQINLSNVEVDSWKASYHWDAPSDLIDFKANVWATRVDMETRLAQAVPYFPPFFIPADDPRYAEIWTYGGDISNTSYLATGVGDVRLNYGGSYLLEKTDGEEYCSRSSTTSPCVWLHPAVGSREIASAFSSFEWEINDWLRLDGGLRYDVFRLKDDNDRSFSGVLERDGGRLSPRLAVTLEPYEGFQLFAQYSEGMRPPTLRETILSDANTTPNPYLDPEIAKNWEFGANFLKENLLAPDDKMKFKAAYFINNTENYISRATNSGPWEPGEDRYLFKFVNLDRAKFEGIEISGGYDAGFFFSDFAATYYTDFEFCDAEGCSSGTVQSDYAVNHLPPELSVSATFGMRFFEEKLVVGVRGIRNSERLAPVPDGADTQRTAFWLPYTVFDAFATYDVNDHVRLEVQAENLTDKYYVDAIDGWMAAPGRTIRAALTAKF